MSIATTALDSGIDAINASIGDGADDSTQLIAAKCRALLRGYDARWRDSGYVTVECEKTLTAPLVNPDTGAKSRTFDLGGKLDVIATYEGRLCLIDHKTTSVDIQDPDAPYWRQLVVEGQASHYGILGWANGYKFESTVWDAIRKPTISPKKLTKAERAHVVSSERYFDIAISRPSLELLIGEDRESIEMYEARLTNDCTSERPQWYFQRRPVPRVDFELMEYAKQLWDISQDIITTRAQDRHHKNSGACMMYGSPCKFLGVCSGHDEITSDNWQKKEHRHAELGNVEGDRELLTNSRVRNFQTCKKKHQFEYDMAMQRFNEEEKEALFFGTLMHEGLEAWWNCFREVSN
jgi:hypothetical protein